MFYALDTKKGGMVSYHCFVLLLTDCRIQL